MQEEKYIVQEIITDQAMQSLQEKIPGVSGSGVLHYFPSKQVTASRSNLFRPLPRSPSEAEGGRTSD